MLTYARPSTSTAGFSAPRVCELAGVTYRQLDYWARTDLVRPSLVEARGSGTQRRYSRDDLAVVTIIARCLAAGVSLQRLRRAVPELRAELGRLERRRDGLWFAVDAAGDAYLSHDLEVITDLLAAERRPAYVVPIDLDHLDGLAA